jgi:hypothetical protein
MVKVGYMEGNIKLLLELNQDMEKANRILSTRYRYQQRMST